MDAIRTEGLTRAFDGVVAVDHLSFTVAEGELFGFVGPDGAGKTTTIRMLTAILDPSAGDAWVAGRHIVRDAESLKDSIGYMSQRFGLYADLTVMENLRFYADIFGVSSRDRETKIEHLLAFSNLAAFKRRLAGNLSGGMKQKLGLACALIHTPKVLFLDEPTNGVDPVSRRDFWKILYQLIREGVTIFISTAYMDEAERCARLALIHKGRLLALGTPDEIRQLMPGAVLEVCAAHPRQVAELLRGGLHAGAVGLFGERIHVAGGDPEEVRALLEKAGMPAEHIRPRVPSLEDVFVAVLDRSNSPGARPLPVVAGPAVSTGIPAALPPAASAPSPVTVAIRDLEKKFGTFTAVNRISFGVRKGEIFGFLGPNGAGKSTTIRMLCGILAPGGGSGTVAGYDMRTQPELIKNNIGYMSQKFSLYEDLTVEENIDFYSGIYRIPAGRRIERKEWVLRMAGLEQHRQSRTAVLSGGWKQRLALGCAILHEPPVLFLDEPTSGVDPINRRQFWELIHELAGRGVTVFVTTHYMDEAEYCDRLALIYRGELIAIGTPAELKASQMQGEVVAGGRNIPSMEDVFVALIEAHDRAGEPQVEVRR